MANIIKLDKIKWIVLLILLLASYLLLTNWIQTEKLYPYSSTWFYFDEFQKYAPQDCFKILPNYVTFYGKEKIFEVHTSFMKSCEFSEARASFSVTDMQNYYIENKKNLKFNSYIEPDRQNYLIIEVNSSDMERSESYPIILRFKLKEGFYNFYHLRGEGYNIEQFQLVFDNGLKGYNCVNEGCLTVLEGNVKDEEPIWRGHVKEWRFDGDKAIIRFNPISNTWFLAQKLLDALILGWIVVIFYDLFFKRNNDKRILMRK